MRRAAKQHVDMRRKKNGMQPVEDAGLKVLDQVCSAHTIPPARKLAVPLQENSYDCGMFALGFAAALLKFSAESTRGVASIFESYEKRVATGLLDAIVFKQKDVQGMRDDYQIFVGKLTQMYAKEADVVVDAEAAGRENEEMKAKMKEKKEARAVKRATVIEPDKKVNNKIMFANEEEVEAMFDGQTQWFAGVVVRVREGERGNLYDVLYNDGDFDSALQGRFLRKKVTGKRSKDGDDDDGKENKGGKRSKESKAAEGNDGEENKGGEDKDKDCKEDEGDKNGKKSKENNENKDIRENNISKENNDGKTSKRKNSSPQKETTDNRAGAKRAKASEVKCYEEWSSSSEDEDSVSSSESSDSEGVPREHLGPGDVVEYWNTAVFACGDKRGWNETTVIETLPPGEGTRMLVLLNGDCLNDSDRVRRKEREHEKFRRSK